MGIPQLATHLRPFAEYGPLQGDIVAIDGPAFAYHVFHLCRAHSPSNSPYDQPSYSLLGQTAVKWLDYVQSRGVTVSSIFFDGSLPPSKLPVRLESSAGSFFVQGKPPAPPFLVPAVIEALSSSDRYRPLTQVVPGEADEYCAHHAFQHGSCTVLTSDSDLLLYDLGETGSVALFRDIELKFQKPDASSLYALKFTPASIASKLRLPKNRGLLRLAYESTRDYHASIKQLVQRAKGANPSMPDENFETFVRQYDSSLALQESVSFATLDPRIAELVLQCWFSASSTNCVPDRPSGSGEPDRPREYRIFLPSLLDSATRSSAWDTGVQIRRLAYGVLQNFACRKPLVVSEYRRLHTASQGRQIQLSSLSSLIAEATALSNLLTAVGRQVTETNVQWIILTLHQDILLALERGGITSPSLAALQEMAIGAADLTSWDLLHLISQVQATHYSCRILQQILKFCSSRPRANLPVFLEELSQSLSALPSLADFPSGMALADMLMDLRQGSSLAPLLHIFESSQDITNQLILIMDPPTKGGKRSRKERESGCQDTTTSRSSNNPFDALLALDS